MSPVAQEEITEIGRTMKPFKQALNDLKSMGKAALARGTKAAETAKKTMEAQRLQTSSSQAATATLQETKRRKCEAAKVQNFFQLRLSLTSPAAVAIAHLSLTDDMKLQAGVSIDITAPVIVRVPQSFLESFKQDVEECKAAFTDSAVKATSGRAIRSCSKDHSLSFTFEWPLFEWPLLGQTVVGGQCASMHGLFSMYGGALSWVGMGTLRYVGSDY